MPRLIITQGLGTGRIIDIDRPEMIVGRSPGLDISLEGGNVSRRHARFLLENQQLFVEDLGSSNGTLVNEKRIADKTPLRPNDLIRFGSYALRIQSLKSTADLTIQQQTAASANNAALFRENASRKLQALLQLADHLALSLDPDTLLNRFLDQLLNLFPHAERALFVAMTDSEPTARWVKQRNSNSSELPQFSRTVMRSVFEKKLGVLAEDTSVMEANVSLNVLGIRSLLCVPLRSSTNRMFGAVQLDRFEAGRPFTPEDLHFLTALALHVSTVLENAALHQELVVQERLQRDLALARDIQQGFLPTAKPDMAGGPVDLHGELHPAQEVAGDFYDYFVLDDQSLAFVVADVSGKGMPAALFMTMVRALLRQLTVTSASPAAILERLNDALARDNPRFMFVTVLFGFYNVQSGECTFCRAGHPPALLRRSDSSTATVEAPAGVLLGIESPCRPLANTTLVLRPGDAICVYTDGVTEAAQPTGSDLFGTERLLRMFQNLKPSGCISGWSRQLRTEVAAFCQGTGPQDDITLLVLRRPELNGITP